MIDRALADYAAAEPLAGLEQRVLGRVHAAHRRRRWFAFAAVPALAAIIAAVVLVPKPHPGPMVATSAPRRAEPPLPSAAVVTPPPPPPALVRRKAVHHRTPMPPQPKREFFPTITPVTRQEQVLVELAKTHPQDLLARPAETIEIKPLVIAPLSADGTH